VIEGFVSLEVARKEYGVALRLGLIAGEYEIEMEATLGLRKALKKSREI
jgi:hypothetical protein